MRTVAAYSIQECLRRRIFLVVAVLTTLFGVLYTLGAWAGFNAIEDFSEGAIPVDERVLAGATFLGLATFGTLFLGAVLAVFLTLGAVRGDAERGVLQPVIVRPVGRREYLLARVLAASVVSGAYAAAVFCLTVLVTGLVGGWWPDRVLEPALSLFVAMAVICSLSLLGSVFLAATTNGIATFMVFGAGLFAGLLRQIADALDLGTLQDVSAVLAWLLPFEGLYQHALHRFTADTAGLTRVALDLGPLGGAHEGGLLLWLFAPAYVAFVTASAVVAFRRRDL